MYQYSLETPNGDLTATRRPCTCHCPPKRVCTQVEVVHNEERCKTWAERIERESEEYTARGTTASVDITVAQLVDWYRSDVGKLKRISKTQAGNLTRIVEGLGLKVVQRLTVTDVIEHVRRRISGQHVRSDGTRIPPCAPATMNVELGYLTELLKLGTALANIAIVRDPVVDTRPVLRLMKLVGKSKKRKRRPTPSELVRLRDYFTEQAWRMRLPMVANMDFAIATAKRESEITRLLRSNVDVDSCSAPPCYVMRNTPSERRQPSHFRTAGRCLDYRPAAAKDR